MKKSLFMYLTRSVRLPHCCSAPRCAWAKFAFKDFIPGVRR
jgi:hypothetical protein